jgi:hypothetical protein
LALVAKVLHKFSRLIVVVCAVDLLLLLGKGTADKADAELPMVDLATARTLLLKETPSLPWLLREAPRPLGFADLAELVPVEKDPTLEANSEQREPLHIGATPREKALYGRTAALPRLPLPLKTLAERQALWIADHLDSHGDGHSDHALKDPPAKDTATKDTADKEPSDKETPDGRMLELELWPTQNEVGRLTWVISRYRRAARAPWLWLDAALQRDDVADPNLVHEPHPILPEHLSPASRRGYIAIFRDFLAADTRDLYEKPSFSECVWTNADKTAAFAAWRPSIERPAQRAYFEHASDEERRSVFCIALPQPARFNERPLTLHLRLQESKAAPGTPKVQFLDKVEWVNPPTEHPLLHPLRQAVREARLPAFPANFDDEYRHDAAMLAGAIPLPTGLRLSRKNSADPQHQLEALLDYLEQRYQKLGFSTRRQRLVYRGIPESNLIAILPGRKPAPGASALPPIVLCDHIDTAFSEDVFARSNQRVSAPGVDDNASASATLLRAADALRSVPEELRHRDIWLLHLTGEEFPADDLGARKFISELLQTHTDVATVLLVDMIGYNPRRRPEYQLNPGGYYESGETSLRTAEVAALLTPRVAPALRPVIYPPIDLRSYLYNTDGVVFAENGYPVVHISEMMNRYLLSRSGYHDSLDTLEFFDVGYAAAIARVTIATVAVLSELSPTVFPF